jgi:UDP-GlcNAc:undecaprenyl-phosphate GlcNAc-1-phosphate transferase
MTTFAIVIVCSFIVTACLTPGVRRLAIHVHLVDAPDGKRKLHTKTTPLGGGIALLCGSLLTLAGLWLFRERLKIIGDFVPSEYLGLFLAVLVLCGVGLIDDRFGLRGRQKLAGQALACGIMAVSGLVIRNVQLFSWHVELGLLALPFTFFWLLGAINALNLIDGIDGLASTVGCVLSLALACMAYLSGHPGDALLALVLAGSLLGFLCYNFPPASMFLGDTGSMLIGLVLGVLAIRCSLKGPATIALAAPTAIWAIPILDTGMAILRRRLTGRSIYDPDRGHLHHCLLRRGHSNRTTLVWIGLLCASTSVGALLSVWQQSESLAVATVLVVGGTLVVTRLFGHVEVRLLGQRLKHLLLSLVPRPHLTNHRPDPVCTRLQGSGEWEDLWNTLIEFSDRFDLCAVQLNINLPVIHEEYHASWKRKDRPDSPQFWHTDIPLISHDLTVGRLRITGGCEQGSVCVWMGELIAGLKPFETLMLTLVEDQLTIADRPPLATAKTLADHPQDGSSEDSGVVLIDANG